ncbi:glycerophosphoryl diester phosphodiesterase [Aureimonas sp. SA4125]|uniref:glycerophosphodiester phosphodiesterase family protein n=1 Tax=Aureimonas sp. SA4125 TaxID=2826993 RepID=UPI001CC700D7|nr:glycerophosphodiester phosphodiesterase family protein [Aureimonas sp. SA4125]BDA84717.1 glycerophosphoryl diester phosphodiesterase [Aureimonas sp. SA4125]
MAVETSLDWLTRQPIAHRGLHDGNVAVIENTLAAAAAAIAGGYAIECDVSLTRDGVPVVFHDPTLERLTAASGRVADWSAEELSYLRLGDTDQKIPTVAEFLAFVDGKVPVVMEMKGTSPEDDSAFFAGLWPVIAGYSGPLALMSFDAWLIDQALAGCDLPVGLTAEGLRPELLAAHRALVERGCSFVSYSVHHLPNTFVDWLRTERRAPVITWTVRMPEEVALTRAYADQMTFEGFVPQA